MEDKNPWESHRTYEKMNMSMGDNPGVMSEEDDHKWSGHGIKEGGWWISHVPTIYAWAANNQHNLQNKIPNLNN